MDVGIVSTVVAGLFGTLGVIVGFIIGKGVPKPQVQVSPDTERIEKEIKSLSESVKNLSETVAGLAKGEDLKPKLEPILKELENLKNLISSNNINLRSVNQVEESIKTVSNLMKTEKEPANIESLLTSIKDNVMVVRNEIQTLKFNVEDMKKAPKVDSEKLSLAIKNAERINSEAVRGDLLSLIRTIKGEDGSELKSIMDRIALESKELVVILKDLQNQLGVKR